MDSKFRHDDLTYGVLLAALTSFAVATLLAEVPVQRFAAPQAVATAVTTAQGATPMAVASQASSAAH